MPHGVLPRSFADWSGAPRKHDAPSSNSGEGLAEAVASRGREAGRAWLEEIVAHAELAYPEEACGLVFAKPGASLRAVPSVNQAPNPVHGFEMEPERLLAELTDAREREEELVAFYHSHPDAPPSLSAPDVASWVVDGQPLWPGVAALVVAVEKGHTTGVSVYTWSRGRFRAVPLSELDAVTARLGRASATSRPYDR